MRDDREDLTAQREALTAAWNGLGRALDRLAVAAARESRSCFHKHPCADLDDVRAAIAALDRAETAVDTARYDLHTASGGDG